MSVVLLDPRFPAMLPVDAVPLLGGDVAYTEEVPVRIRWVFADLGGHTVEEAGVLITTDLGNAAVIERLDRGEDLVQSPSLLMAMEPDRELEAASGNAGQQSALGEEDHAGNGEQADSSSDTPAITISGGGYVDGEIVGTDEHTAVVAGLRRTTRTEVPGSVMDELEDAVALMTRSIRQGQWEQEQTHHSLLAFLREETEELAEVIEAVSVENEAELNEQELCQELADILLQVLFHAEIANRRGAFDIGHVAGTFVMKMQNRAPYLFEEAERPVTTEEQERLWEEGRVREGKEARKKPQTKSKKKSRKKVAAHKTASPLAAAEEVIAAARAAGMNDTEIPTDIRYPMVGLASDSLGDSEDRLMTAVSTFRRTVDQRIAAQGNKENLG